jgi:hypothetical protein
MWLAPVPFRPHVERAGTLIPGGGTPSMSGVTPLAGTWGAGLVLIGRTRDRMGTEAVVNLRY